MEYKVEYYGDNNRIETYWVGNVHRYEINNNGDLTLHCKKSQDPNHGLSLICYYAFAAGEWKRVIPVLDDN